MKKEEIYFVEKQRLPLWNMALVPLFLIPIFFALHNEPITLCFVTMFFVIMAICFWALFCMQTYINSDGIYVKIFILKKYFEWKDIEKAYIRKYSPVSEYRGWGYRVNIISQNGAINMRGNIGLQLELKNGKNVLIGTQQPQEIEAILDRINKISKIKNLFKNNHRGTENTK